MNEKKDDENDLEEKMKEFYKEKELDEKEKIISEREKELEEKGKELDRIVLDF